MPDIQTRMQKRHVQDEHVRWGFSVSKENTTMKRYLFPLILVLAAITLVVNMWARVRELGRGKT